MEKMSSRLTWTLVKGAQLPASLAGVESGATKGRRSGVLRAACRLWDVVQGRNAPQADICTTMGNCTGKRDLDAVEEPFGPHRSRSAAKLTGIAIRAEQAGDGSS